MIITENSKTITNQEECATVFNKFFVVSVVKLTENMMRTNEYMKYLHYEGITTELEFEETTTNEIADIIKSMNSSAAVGLDKISTFLLKFLVDILAPIISKLINKSFSDGFFPETLKKVKVVPVYKAGDKTLLNNYRGITIPSALSKIAEIVLLHRMQRHIINFNLMNQNQFGFSPHSNTTAATLHLVNAIQQSLDKSLYVAVVFIDLSKAFDCVDHHLLLEKLNSVITV